MSRLLFASKYWNKMSMLHSFNKRDAFVSFNNSRILSICCCLSLSIVIFLRFQILIPFPVFLVTSFVDNLEFLTCICVQVSNLFITSLWLVNCHLRCPKNNDAPLREVFLYTNGTFFLGHLVHHFIKCEVCDF